MDYYAITEIIERMSKLEIIMQIIWYHFSFHFISMAYYSYRGDILDDIYGMLATYIKIAQDK